MIPARLQPGDEVRVVSPATSLAYIPADQRATASERLEDLGLRVTYSANSELRDRFDSSPAEARAEDLHAAFADPGVKAILTTLGGYNSNGLLDRLDYGLIRENPKILCGFSDITALASAIQVRTGLVTYSGPHFSTFAMKPSATLHLSSPSPSAGAVGCTRTAPPGSLWRSIEVAGLAGTPDGKHTLGRKSTIRLDYK